jgi:hypothetical protein
MSKKWKISLIVGACVLAVATIIFFVVKGATSSDKKAPGELHVVEVNNGASSTEASNSVANVEVDGKSTTNTESKTEKTKSAKEIASEYLKKFDDSKFYDGLSNERIEALTKARHIEEAIKVKSTLVISRHPQNEKDDDQYTHAIVIDKNLQADKEVNYDGVKNGILDKLHKAYNDLAKMSKTSASAFDMEGIANDYFYRVQNGVMSFIIWSGNDWKMDDSSLKVYQYDNDVYQYTIAWKKDGKVMGYMMGTYYNTPKSTELVSFSMTQAGSEDNYAQKERGAIKK